MKRATRTGARSSWIPTTPTPTLTWVDSSSRRTAPRRPRRTFALRWRTTPRMRPRGSTWGSHWRIGGVPTTRSKRTSKRSSRTGVWRTPTSIWRGCPSRRGIVHHVVWDDRLSRQARENLAVLGLADVVQFHVGEAVGTLQQAPGPFDVIFNDIDKQDYPKALDVITTKLRPGGLLLVDNMLWSGRIFERRDTSPATRGVRELTRRIQADPQWIASVIPVRDGLLVAQRVEEPLGLSDTLNTRAKESSE